MIQTGDAIWVKSPSQGIRNPEIQAIQMSAKNPSQFIISNRWVFSYSKYVLEKNTLIPKLLNSNLLGQKTLDLKAGLKNLLHEFPFIINDVT